MKTDTYHFARVSIGLDPEIGFGAICLPHRDFLVILWFDPDELRRMLAEYHEDNDVREALLLARKMLECPLLRAAER